MNHQYAIEVVTPPASEPVSLSELKAHLRINTTAEDTLLTSYITASREMFEMLTGRVCEATTFRQHVPKLNGPIALVKAPITSVVAVKYYDENNVLQTLSGYQTDLISVPSWVWMTGGYPSLSINKQPAVQVEFIAGWTTVPQMVKQAIMLLAAHYFKNREAYTSTSFELRDLPMGFRSVCDQYLLGVQGYGKW